MTLSGHASISSEAIRLLRQLKTRSEESADPDDIKRAPGGIRDVEFSVQLLQLVHGRADPELRSTGTLPAISALTAGGYVRQDDADALADSYRFLRNVEHRLQIWQMAQTHRLPADREQLAFAMGYRSSRSPGGRAVECRPQPAPAPGQDASMNASTTGRSWRLLPPPPPPVWPATGPSPASKRSGLSTCRPRRNSIEDLTTGMSRRSRLMQQLLPLMVEWLADSSQPGHGPRPARDPGRGQPRQRRADRHPPRPSRCRPTLVPPARIEPTGSAPLSTASPSSFPASVDDKLLLDLPSPEDTFRALERMQLRPDLETPGWLRSGGWSADACFAPLPPTLLGLVTVDRVASALSDTADAAALAALWTATQAVQARCPSRVMAMGKWGGRELGYGSDLDLVYVSGSTDDTPGGPPPRRRVCRRARTAHRGRSRLRGRRRPAAGRQTGLAGPLDGGVFGRITQPGRSRGSCSP